MSSVPTNSSRKRRRRLLSEREYRGEQRALHDLGQVHEREHRPVDVREVRAKDVLFVRGEVLRHVLHRTAEDTGTAATAAGMRRALCRGRSEHQPERARDHGDRQIGDGPSCDAVDRERELPPLDVDLDLAARSPW